MKSNSKSNSPISRQAINTKQVSPSLQSSMLTKAKSELAQK